MVIPLVTSSVRLMDIPADDWDTAFEVCRLLPLPPGLARVFTTVFGPDYLKERGFTNLMEE